jgi:hypothetical protein
VQVMLRNVLPQDEALLQRVCEGVCQRGFINYYGLQRFGTGQSYRCWLPSCLLNYSASLHSGQVLTPYGTYVCELKTLSQPAFLASPDLLDGEQQSSVASW